MFELQVALKYLIPKWRQLSVSIISLISVLVIALVVWLLVVFFSVTWGLEKAWVQKLLALTAPVRITPTENYYDSYYYKIDAISQKSNWQEKNLQQKRDAKLVDPYDPTIDEEFPQSWLKPDLHEDGSLKDPVKELFQVIDSQGLKASIYTIGVSELKLFSKQSGNEVTYNTFISSFDPENKALQNSICAEKECSALPTDLVLGEGIILPKGFKESGVSVGDRGALLYRLPTTSGLRVQTIPVFVAAFYDPGLVPIGSRMIIANESIVQSITAPLGRETTTGIHLRFDDINQASAIKNQLVKKLESQGIAPYWNVETYREFDFSKDFLQQLRSEKNLFSLISAIIIIVACSNIISMLIILVNDKKKEIGILRSMGASTVSIAAIFAISGLAMGALGSLIGVIAATLTLKNLQSIIDLMSRLQGFEAFNPLYFGDKLPNELSPDALVFVMGVTTVLSVVAGLIPAMKACRLKPSELLRSE
jgi:ABC-type lipoprotein release transport system permease subunit